MRMKEAFLISALVTSAAAPVQAYEANSAMLLPGVFIGSSAATPPAGIYMFDRVNTLQSNLAGPVTNVIGKNTGLQVATGTVGALFVPGWTFLGATYSAAVAQPFQMQTVGSPSNVQASGMYNTYIAPGELSWKLGESGFFVKAGLGMHVPDGTKNGANGMANVGAPYWTLIPQLTLSYFKDGWNLSSSLYQEFNTANSITGYKTGNILHADFTATKRTGRWTFGPVGYYVGQVSDDQSSAFYNYRIQRANRYDRVAVGALLAYDFGPATLTAWGVQNVYSTASGASNGGPIDLASVPHGFSASVSLSYRLWAPEQDSSTPGTRLFTK